ncbi:hypothetical protein [Corynebacterium sp. HMSC068G04]|uniref:hypothetical protein n=1 Tax=Corynebacterium sp. HMSC068G04 TaxID=1739497 RepID=UPI000ABFD370|nr:hypothetical protein [Corynebacterium sp. HMSC068G04]
MLRNKISPLKTVLAISASSLLVACAPEQSAYQPSGLGIIDVMVPYSAGGGTDTWGRFITQEFATRLDGVDRFQIENVPGGETITGANSYVKSGVTNGDYVLVASATTYFQDMLNHKAAEFDFASMEPLAFNGTGAVLWTSNHSGIKSIDDLLNSEQEYVFGGMSASGLDLVALLALEALGVENKGVFGFEGRGASRLATQRGETDLDFQTTATYLSQLKEGEDDGEVVPLFSIGVPDGDKVKRDPNLSALPTFDELYHQQESPTKEQQLAYEAFQSFVVPGFYYQKGLWANQGTDPEVIDQYDKLVKDLNADKEFSERANTALGGYDLVSGKEAKRNFDKAMNISPEVEQYIVDLLLDKYGTAIH